MNGIARLLVDLGGASVELAAHGDRLRHRLAMLAPDLSARLRLHKAAILTQLDAGDGYAPDPEATYMMGERLGIADALNIPTHPGSPVWLIAVGDSMEYSCTNRIIGVQS